MGRHLLAFYKVAKKRDNASLRDSQKITPACLVYLCFVMSKVSLVKN